MVEPHMEFLKPPPIQSLDAKYGLFNFKMPKINVIDVPVKKKKKPKRAIVEKH